MVLLGFRGALLLHPLMKIYINHGHHTNGIPYLAFASESKRGCWSSLSCREKKKKKTQVFKAGELSQPSKVGVYPYCLTIIPLKAARIEIMPVPSNKAHDANTLGKKKNIINLKRPCITVKPLLSLPRRLNKINQWAHGYFCS